MSFGSSIDREKVMQRGLRGLYTGIGAVVSGSVGNLIAGRVEGSDFIVAGGEIAIGAGLSIFADEIFSDMDSIPNETLEYAGYGIQAVGWDEAFESLRVNFGNGGSQSRVVDVTSNGQTTGASVSQATTQVG